METPKMMAYARSSSATALGTIGSAMTTTAFHPQQAVNTIAWNDAAEERERYKGDLIRQAERAVDSLRRPQQQEQPMANQNKRRIVQVFIADTDENVPLDDSVIYRGGEHLTDLTDQELFFSIDIKSLLDKHNAKRVKFVNKKVKERVENLEPVKIRDLKMVVVTVAEF